MPLNIDITSGGWRAVAAYVADRMAELSAECCAVATSADRRAELAARIAELRELLDAPDSARRTAAMNTTASRIY